MALQRITDDVDLFAPIDRATGEMTAAVERATAAYTAAGYEVEVTQQVPTYSRLSVTDPSTGHRTKVELVAEFLHHPPVESELGPLLHRADLAAGRPEPCFSRAEARDATTSTGCFGRVMPGSG